MKIISLAMALVAAAGIALVFGTALCIDLFLSEREEGCNEKIS